jgi:hypothetical protein
VANCITEARRSGYERIVVAGYSRGLAALLAATLPDVDAAIGTPLNRKLRTGGRERTRDVLAQNCRRGQACRGFFEVIRSRGFERTPGGRCAARSARQRLTFMVVDRPPDLRYSAAHGRCPQVLIASCGWFWTLINRPARFNAPGRRLCGRCEIGFPARSRPKPLPDAGAPYLGRR